MRKITILQHISLDGIIQSPGGPDEDRDGEFGHGGWVAPFDDPAVGKAVTAAHEKPFDLLLGRRTYDIWAGYWPKNGNNIIGAGINAATKYVATHSPESLAWGPVQHLGDDIVVGIRQLKATDGPEVLVWGSSSLTPLLLQHSLADEVLLFIYPVLIGQGKRFFTQGFNPCELSLLSSEAGASGVLINRYQPNGPMRVGSF